MQVPVNARPDIFLFPLIHYTEEGQVHQIGDRQFYEFLRSDLKKFPCAPALHALPLPVGTGVFFISPNLQQIFIYLLCTLRLADTKSVCISGNLCVVQRAN